MNKKRAKERINKLKKEIEHHRYLYHVLDRQEISDAALDSLKHELLELEKLYPELITEDSPTQRIGGKPLDKFKKIKHRVKQWSLEDAFSESEIRDWDKRIKKLINQKTGENLTSVSYNCELKIDGIHIVLNYKDGILETAATRGDGEIGEDITNNIKTIEAVPIRIRKKISLVVEGEVFIRKSIFETINEERKKRGENPLANPRNAAAGAVRQLDPVVTRSRRLDFFAYDISWSDKKLPENQYEELKKLKSLGFKVNKNYRLVENIDQVIKLWKEWDAKRKEKDYWLDGLVIKINSRYFQERLAFTGKSPRWAIALKYPGEEATTIVEDIKLSLGRTGKITPVAELKPVEIAGTKVSRASLHNMDEINRLDVRKGDTVVVYKAGDIIPQVQRVIKSLRPKGSQGFKLPDKCPICGSKIIKPKGEVNHYCSNKSCASLEKKKLHHFVSKKGFDIDGLGPKIVDRLMDKGLISSPIDIFDLEEGDLSILSGFADKSAKNLIEAINESKNINFQKFLASLGIKHIGSEATILIESYIVDNIGKISSIEKLAKELSNLSIEDIREIEGLGPKISKSLISYFKNKKNLDMMEKLEKSGIKITFSEKGQRKENIWDKTFVFTGSLKTINRDEAKEKISFLGGKTSSSVSKNTDFLIVGDDPGSKLKEAKKIGIKTINEKEFLKLIS